MNLARVKERKGFKWNLQLKFEWVDLLVLLYLLAFVRQYFWGLSHNGLAWILSAVVAIAIWYLYVSTKQTKAHESDVSFWLVVVVPLLFAYLLRAAFPDRSFDVLTYHLLHSERSLRGPLFATGDFFPTLTAFNPIADTITGISRLLLGFRLGTIINLLALLWVGKILTELLRPLLLNPWLRSVCVLLVLLAEHLLFEITTYMVDLLALPLLLQATLLTLNIEDFEDRRASFVHVAVLLGAAIAFKFTNLAAALPILLLAGYRIFFSSKKFSPRQLATTLVFMTVGFIAPFFPFTVYIYRLTGNPVFPVANTLFKSPYFPTDGGWDNRWGPHTFFETILWPIIIWFEPERHSELAAYSGRLSLGVIVAIAGLVLTWRNSLTRTLCILLLGSSFLWSATALGYSRYGLYQELLAGSTCVAVAAVLLSQSKWRKVSLRSVVGATVFALLLAQTFVGLSFVLDKEWGGRVTLLADPRGYAREMKLMLRDHSLLSFLRPEDRVRAAEVNVWFETAPKSTGLEVMLNPRAPIIALRQPEFFITANAWREFIRQVKATPGKHMYSLCLADDLATAKEAIAKRHLEVALITALDIPFFSPRDRIGMMLIEIRIPQQPEARELFETAWMQGAFPASDYREEITALDPPVGMHPGEKADLRFKVRNLGSTVWPSVGTKDFRYQVNMGNRWIANGIISEDNRAVMPADLPPGAETEIKLTVNAPKVPGDYLLEIDMVHEGVTWFKEKGGRPLSLQVRVKP